MSQCRHVQRRLDATAVSARLRIAADDQRHLETCGPCRQAWSAAQLVRGALASLTLPEEPPPDFSSRVSRALRGLRFRQEQPCNQLWRSAWELIPAFGLAVVILAFFSPAEVEHPVTSWLGGGPLSVAEELVLSPAAPPLDAAMTALLVDDDD